VFQAFTPPNPLRRRCGYSCLTGEAKKARVWNIKDQREMARCQVGDVGSDQEGSREGRGIC